MTYTAFDERDDIFYNINSFDEYAENKEINPIVEEMLKTFEILQKD